MQQEQRTAFRFDVNIPMKVDFFVKDKPCLYIEPQRIFVKAESEKAHYEQKALRRLFSDLKYIQNGGVDLFKVVNEKLEWMQWLLTQLTEDRYPTNTDEFYQRLQEDQKRVVPSDIKGEKVSALLNGVYAQLNEYIEELIDLLNRPKAERVLMFQTPVPDRFDATLFIPTLEEQAEKDLWVAKVIILLNKKLNRIEAAFSRLKQRCSKIANPEKWPVESVNLAHGGFSFYTNRMIEKGSHVCGLFWIDDQIVVSKAECVYMDGEPSFDEAKRAAFRFDDISHEDTAHIVRFINQQELLRKEQESE